MAGRNPWISTEVKRSGVQLRLLCFPHAGGGGAIYRSWIGAMPGVDVCPIELPGRFERLREPLPGSIGELVEALDTGLGSLLDELPVALFGYSFGAVVAFELARQLRRTRREPSALVVAARRAPECPGVFTLGDLPDDQFLERIQRMNGPLGRGLIDDPDMRRYVLRVTRADIQLLERYEYREEPPLCCPILVCGGSEDISTSPEELEAWRRHTSGAFGVTMFDGGHFFLREHGAKLVDTVRSFVASVAHAGPGDSAARAR